MSTSVIKANPQLPAAIAKLVALATPQVMSELSGGITSGYPIISYKGKVWRIRRSGEEIMYLDAQGNPMPTIDVVLVQANPHPSKIFYEKKYEEGSNEPPRCFSNEGITPDASVQAPISKTCAACPNNVWGSRITDAGKKSRACSDARRMAVVFASDLTNKGVDCDKFMLRVPPASLNPLKDYGEKTLAPRGIPFFAVVTRISFDVNATHPQFQFKPVRLLSEVEAEDIVNLRDSDDIKRILAEAQEFPAGETAEAVEPSDASADTPASAAAATTPPAGKPAKTKAAMRPATEEEAGAAVVATPAPKAAAAAKAAPATAKAAPDPFFAEPTPSPTKTKGTKAKPVEAVLLEEEEEPTQTTAGQGTPEFDSLLDSILNG